jgi:Tfp pilus assembly protein PilZ
MKKSPAPSSNKIRRHPRIVISIEVDWGETPACVHKGRITSLSVGGCFVQTPLEVAKGKPVFIRVFLAPESERVTEGMVWGRVAYHLPEVGLGVEFKRLPPGYEEHIQDLVEFHLEGGKGV